MTKTTPKPVRPSVANLDKRVSLVEQRLDHHVSQKDLAEFENSMIEKLMELRTETQREHREEHAAIQEQFAQMSLQFDRIEENRREEHKTLNDVVLNLRMDYDRFRAETTASMRTTRNFLVIGFAVVEIGALFIAHMISSRSGV